MTQFKARIISNEKLAPDHFVLMFKAEKEARKTKPGQFFTIKVNDSNTPLLRRPFGAHIIEKGRIGILYKVVGKATKILSTKKKGETLDILGPLGNGFNLEHVTNRRCCEGRAKRGTKQSQVILVAGGHGAAPLAALAKELIAYRLSLIAYIGARTKKHVVCGRDFRKLGAKVHIATDDGSKGYKGLVTDLLKREITKPKTKNQKPKTAIYACGPNPMLKEVAGIAKHYGIQCQVSLEEYMACGIGTCLGCAVKTRAGYKMVCKDGPVFNAKEIVWK